MSKTRLFLMLSVLRDNCDWLIADETKFKLSFPSTTVYGEAKLCSLLHAF